MKPIDELGVAPGHREDEWERMIAAFRQSAPRSDGAPPWLETRVMAEIEALPAQGPLGRAIAWLVRPVSIRLPPLAGALVTALFIVTLWAPQGGDGSRSSPPPEAGAVAEVDEEAVVYVQFVLEAPSASSVEVAGDFSDWQPAFTLDDLDGDGVWTGRVPVQPGVHAYMFLIDGTRWETDPRAERYADDGFGNRNAVLAVAAGA